MHEDKDPKKSAGDGKDEEKEKAKPDCATTTTPNSETTVADDDPKKVARVPVGASTLSQLEQDIAAKSKGSTGASRPGAVAVSGGGGGPSTLSQLEQLIAAKTRAAGASRPGAVTEPTACESTLSQLEQDVAAKSKGGAVASRPGAVAAGGGSSALSQLEQDVAAKSRAGAARSTQPGAVLTKEAGASALNQLEQKFAAKSKGGTVTARPGAVAVAGGSSALTAGASSLSQLEQGVIAKAGSSGSGSSSSLSHMQEEAAAKTRATTGISGGAAALSQLERDVAAKNGPAGGDACHPSAVSVEAGASSLGHFEQDVIAKSQASGGRLSQSSVVQSELSQLEQEVLSKSRASGGFAVGGVTAPRASSQMKEVVEAEYAAATTESSTCASGVSIEEYPAFSSMRELESQIIDITHVSPAVAPIVGLSAGVAVGQFMEPSSQEGDRAAAPLMDPEGPLYPGLSYGSEDVAENAIDGIEAFVADNVVDAFGVEVITSEEEEEKVERQRQKRIRCRFAVLALLVVAIALPVAIVVSDGSSPLESDSPAPTAAPSEAPTPSPTSPLLSIFTDCLASLSATDDVFSDRLSPQFRAASWLSSKDLFLAENPLECTDPKLIQRYALAVFYFSVGGDNWIFCGQSDPGCVESTAKVGWLSSSDECFWFRIECNENGFVDEINFADTTALGGVYISLVGTIPFEISHLTEMVLLDLSGNLAGERLGGPITGIFSGMPVLEEISLENNALTGPIPLTFADDNPLLKILNLGINSFSGPIPASLTRLPLRILQLYSNQVAGNLPEDIGNMVELGKLDTVLCQASSTLSGSHTFVSSIETLDLQNNRLDGEIPLSLYSMTALEEVILNRNFFVGAIPSDISQMQSLQVLDLGRTNMGGEIPPEVFGLISLEELYLDNASFGGPLTEDFALLNGTIKEISLSNNAFTGAFPTVLIENLVGLGTFALLDPVMLVDSPLDCFANWGTFSLILLSW